MRILRRCSIAAALLFAAIPARAQLQLGLRLDPLSSIQWLGTTLYLEGRDRRMLTTTAGAISDVSVGPTPGAFGVTTEQGVGVLLGRDVILGARPGGAGAIVRSSRYDAMWVYGPSTNGEIRQIVTGGGSRAILRVAKLVDYDVDVRGRIIYLAPGDSIVVVTAPDQRTAMALPAELRGATRVFVDAAASEIAVYAPGSVGWYAVETGSWRVRHFAEATDALVRQAWDRRMVVEPRFLQR